MPFRPITVVAADTGNPAIDSYFANSKYFTFHGWRPIRFSKSAELALEEIRKLGFEAVCLGIPILRRKSDLTSTGGSFIYYALTIKGVTKVFSCYRDLHNFVEGFRLAREVGP